MFQLVKKEKKLRIWQGHCFITLDNNCDISKDIVSNTGPVVPTASLYK